MNEVKNLVELLNKYRDSYYNKNTTIISDKEYDELFDKLQELENKTGIVYANSPTVTVGYETVSKLKKVQHNHKLLSLNKTTLLSEFRAYFSPHLGALSAKLDGLTASILYEDGKLVSGETRGNGEVGEDITHNVKVFSNLPHQIPYKGRLIVDGECIIDYDTFTRINEQENTEYKNPRNLVSGTVRQLNSEIAARRNVKFVAWRLYSELDEFNQSYIWNLKFLESLGFEVVPSTIIESHKEDSRWECDIQDIRDECERLRYPIDGIVCTFDDIKYGNQLGVTGHHPKHSLAYKFYQEENETTLLDIEWNTSRTGVVNPVAIVEPVDIDGTTVSRASLSNVSIIKELQLGLGDRVTIIKANQIIPKITSNLTKSGTYVIPTVCPTCGSHLFLRNDTGRETLVCRNPICGAIMLDKFSNFVGREGMDINGLSEERLKVLLEKGFISDFPSLFVLYKVRNELIEIEGFGESSVDNILSAIDNSKKVKFSNLLVAIGIPGIGKSNAKSLSSFIRNHNENGANLLNSFLNMCLNNFDWSELPDFGETTRQNINAYIQVNYAQIRNLFSLIVLDEEVFQDSTQILKGKTYCITGSLNIFENRKALISEIEKHGGKVVNSISSTTDFLITNDPQSGSSKNTKAKSCGTSIITELEFIEQLKA